MFCFQGLSIPLDRKGRLAYWLIYVCKIIRHQLSPAHLAIRSSMLIPPEAYWIMILWHSLPCWYREDVSEADRVGSTLDAEVFLKGTLPLNFQGLLANRDKVFAYFIVVFCILFKDSSPRLLLYGLPIVCSVIPVKQFKQESMKNCHFMYWIMTSQKQQYQVPRTSFLNLPLHCYWKHSDIPHLRKHFSEVSERKKIHHTVFFRPKPKPHLSTWILWHKCIQLLFKVCFGENIEAKELKQ